MKFYLKNKRNVEDGEYRIIQVNMKHLEESQKENILNEVREIFPNSVDYFFYQHFLLIVEKRGIDNLFVNDLEGIFLAFDMDFDLSTRIFLGLFHVWKHDFNQLLLEEKQVLWKQQGNFSSAAKELFMHRNSLIYKILTEEKVKGNYSL